MSDLYFNEESYYSEENTCDNDVFRYTILQLFHFETEQKKSVVIRAMRKNLHLFTLQLHIRIENFNCSASEASRHPAFIGICPTISHTF